MGRADFRHCHFSPSTPRIDSTKAPFRGGPIAEYNFEGTIFTERADFSGAAFAGLADFRRVTFADLADFRGVTFSEHAFFGRVTFAERAKFDRVTFAEHAYFRDADFARRAHFGGAAFAGRVDFSGADFAEKADFKDATFNKRVVLGMLSADWFVLDGARFEQYSLIEVLAETVSAVGARFDAGVELRVGYARVSLRRTFFGAPSSLTGVPEAGALTADPAWADLVGLTARPMSNKLPRAITRKRVNVWLDRRSVTARSVQRGGIEDWMPQLYSLQEADVAQLTVADVDLLWCRFAGAHHLDELRVEGMAPFNRTPGWRIGWAWPPVWRWGERRVLAEEHPWRAQRRKYGGWADRFPDLNWKMPSPDVGAERLAVLYRSLRKAFEDGKNEAGAGDFYYGEMDARRHAPSTSRAERLVLTAYWLVSGYGQRASRALALLAATIGVLFALLTTYGLPENSAAQQIVVPAGQVTGVLEIKAAPAVLPPAGQRWTADRAGRAIRVVLGSVVFRDTDQRLTPAGVWTVMAGRALGPLLLALAALAIRARVKR
ncbi:pentapeptide repeat-containing protein [Actinokineospora globicatena]|uniref:pentapeptide repeat-containing protein n=1 Tax=Actinokineospora globicatena TaxID=103729 RepID=UPI0025525AA9|nr:pentapeptide repeat-containing protein [Actinokineospora globicatena]